MIAGKKIQATFKITTPMFLGGAEHKAEIVRGSAVKGALRFWWRALQWGAISEQCKGDESQALKELHREECDLFGSAVDKEQAQAKCLLRVRSIETSNEQISKLSSATSNTGVHYLLGQGLSTYDRSIKGNRVDRQCLQGTFKLSIRFKPTVTDEQLSQVVSAVKALGLMGGLGARARRGWGSLTLLSLDSEGRCTFDPPQTVEDYKAALKSIWPTVLSGLPPFTALSNRSRLNIYRKQTGNAQELLGALGSDFLEYRSFRKNGSNSSHPERTEIAQVDHDNMREFLDPDEKSGQSHPRRVVFGLPHNYFFTSLKKPNNKLNIDAIPKNGRDREATRRASPLFFHVQSIGHEYCAIGYFLPSTFLPDGYEVLMAPSGAAPSSRVPLNIDYDDVHACMDQFLGKEGVINGER